MSRSIQSRQVDRKNVRRYKVRARRSYRKRQVVAACGSRDATARLIGQPLDVTIPILKGIRWRFCTRWDEQPAAQLAKSLLRLGICELTDWSGSAVDFVERGFQRFCRSNNAGDASRVWQGDLRIMDHVFELTERGRHQAEAEMEEPPHALYLVGDYSAAASVPIGPTWPFLEREHELLPAAFYRVLIDNLWTWMRVYDYRAALDHAEMWMEGMEEEELKESFYPKVRKDIPASLHRAEKLSYSKALRLLETLQSKVRGSLAQKLVCDVLELHERGKGYDHAWPGKLAEHVLPLQDFLNDADGCGPGCVITWHEDHEISACFDEEMSTLGQNGPMEPSIMLMMRLDRPATDLDAEVKYVFDYTGAMLRSLASAARAVETIREIYDEYLRKHRLKPGIPIESGAAGIRQEQL